MMNYAEQQSRNGRTKPIIAQMLHWKQFTPLYGAVRFSGGFRCIINVL
ncbi:MAG: hypothetical protein IIA49_15765 [Bacteroidetes bacterium]|nr:hypothetical protein [Bacteroidota bacterium]